MRQPAAERRRACRGTRRVPPYSAAARGGRTRGEVEPGPVARWRYPVTAGRRRAGQRRRCGGAGSADTESVQLTLIQPPWPVPECRHAVDSVPSAARSGRLCERSERKPGGRAVTWVISARRARRPDRHPRRRGIRGRTAAHATGRRFSGGPRRSGMIRRPASSAGARSRRDAQTPGQVDALSSHPHSTGPTGLCPGHVPPRAPGERRLDGGYRGRIPRHRWNFRESDIRPGASFVRPTVLPRIIRGRRIRSRPAADSPRPTGL